MRYTYSLALPTLSPDDDTRGVLLVDHTVSGAGERPLSFSATAEGEPFEPGVLDELSRRLADLPLLGAVGSARDVIGPDHHPTLPQILRPGFLHVLSPIEVTAEGIRVGVELTYPGGQGWIFRLDLTDSGATVIDAQSPWIS